MGKILSILLLLCPFAGISQTQPLTVDDLLALSSLSQKNFDGYMEKKGFSIKKRSLIENCMGFSYFEGSGSFTGDSLPVTRSVDLYKNNDTWCLAFHTTSKTEYIEERNRLKEMDFFSGTKDNGPDVSLLFQKGSLSVEVLSASNDGMPLYTVMVRKKEMPEAGKVQYADDLLRFDSHEYLSLFFGAGNVKKDVYFLSENESRKCTVLFPNSSQQVVFVWDDENNYRKILFVQVSGTMATASTAKYNGGLGQNVWALRNGVYSGMMIKDLLDLNANDFRFYGFNSEYSLMIEPKNTGKINFKRIGIKLTCFNCPGSRIMDQSEVSAEDAVNNNLALHVSAIMLSP